MSQVDLQRLLSAYKTLGVELGASEKACKDAYRAQRSFWHEDRNKQEGARERFTEVMHAFEALRVAKFPTAAFLNRMPGQAGGASAYASKNDGGERGRWPRRDGYGGAAGERTGDPVNDKDKASTARANRNARDSSAQSRWWHHDKKEDRSEADTRKITRTVRLSIEEAARGTVVALLGKTDELCEICLGKKIGQEQICVSCSGRGFMDRPRVEWESDGRGGYTTYACASCSGLGVTGTECKACKGTGVKTRSVGYEVRVKIPPGVKDGTEMVINTEPHTVSGLPLGRVSLRVELKEHDMFWFDETGTLCCHAPVSMLQCVTQDTVEVPTLWGTGHVKVKPGARIIDLKDAGFPNRDGDRQSLRVHIEVNEEPIPEPYLSRIRQAIDAVRATGMYKTKLDKAWEAKLRTWKAKCERAENVERDSRESH